MTEGGSDASGASVALDKFKIGFKGLKSSFAAAVAETSKVASVEAEDASAGSTSGSAVGATTGDEVGSSAGGSSSSWLSWADKARKAVVAEAKQVAYDIVPQTESAREVSVRDPEDLERGSSSSSAASFGKWANKAAGTFKSKINEGADLVGKATEESLQKAKSLDLGGIGEQAKRLKGEVAGGLGRVADVSENAKNALQEKGKAAKEKAKELNEKSKEKLSEASAVAAKKASAAKGLAGNVAGSAKDKLSKAGENIKGLGQLAQSPAKLAQFAGVFVLGVMMISMSLSFLPMLPVAPQKFALLFAFGSMTMMGSFALLKGPKAFAGELIQREKLPFSAAYGVGLVGTLTATIILKSYLLTAFFGIMQALSLLYFLASYIPGGKAALSSCGRLCRKLVCRLMPGNRGASGGGNGTTG